MRSVILALFPCLLAFTVLAAEPVSRADEAGIRRAALDYIEGWYTNDAARMERALHPQMVKRRVEQDAAAGNSSLDHGDAQRLISATRPAPGATPRPLGNRRRDVTILDVFGNAATVKVDADDWVDYLHLVKWNGEWRILNVLWELREPDR
jgi:hypothetical protein